MLSECQNSGKCLLLTLVTFKDGGAHFPGSVNMILGARQNRWKSPSRFLRDPQRLFSQWWPSFLFVVVCFSCHSLSGSSILLLFSPATEKMFYLLCYPLLTSGDQDKASSTQLVM